MYKSILFSLLCFVACNKQDTSPAIYQFKGIIIDVFNAEQKMMIKHDEVPGFMMEMTMMFNIDSSINLNNYSVGDSLNFNFYVLNQESMLAKTWASQIQIVGHRDLKEEEILDEFFDEDKTIGIGEKISNYTFLDLDENEIEIHDFQGKLKFISFIFSRCPMPNFCPAVIMKNQYLINKFKENQNIEFIIISFDYKYDTPNVLKKTYGNIFEDYSNTHFLSSYGYKNNIMNFTEEIGLGFSGIDENDSRDISHTLKSILIDPDGRLITSYSGDSWQTKEVENNIKNILKTYGLD